MFHPPYNFSFGKMIKNQFFSETAKSAIPRDKACSRYSMIGTQVGLNSRREAGKKEEGWTVSRPHKPASFLIATGTMFVTCRSGGSEGIAGGGGDRTPGRLPARE